MERISGARLKLLCNTARSVKGSFTPIHLGRLMSKSEANQLDLSLACGDHLTQAELESIKPWAMSRTRFMLAELLSTYAGGSRTQDPVITISRLCHFLYLTNPNSSTTSAAMISEKRRVLAVINPIVSNLAFSKPAMTYINRLFTSVKDNIVKKDGIVPGSPEEDCPEIVYQFYYHNLHVLGNQWLTEEGKLVYTWIMSGYTDQVPEVGSYFEVENRIAFKTMTEAIVLTLVDLRFSAEVQNLSPRIIASLFNFIAALTKNGNATDRWITSRAALYSAEFPDLRMDEYITSDTLRSSFRMITTFLEAQNDFWTAYKMLSQYYVTVPAEVLQPIQWLIQQAVGRNISSAVVFAESMNSLRFTPLSYILRIVPQSQVKALAKVCACIIRSPWVSLTTPPVPHTMYQDITNLGYSFKMRAMQGMQSRDARVFESSAKLAIVQDSLTMDAINMVVNMFAEHQTQMAQNQLNFQSILNSIDKDFEYYQEDGKWFQKARTAMGEGEAEAGVQEVVVHNMITRLEELDEKKTKQHLQVLLEGLLLSTRQEQLVIFDDAGRLASPIKNLSGEVQQAMTSFGLKVEDLGVPQFEAIERTKIPETILAPWFDHINRGDDAEVAPTAPSGSRPDIPPPSGSDNKKDAPSLSAGDVRPDEPSDLHSFDQEQEALDKALEDSRFDEAGGYQDPTPTESARPRIQEDETLVVGDSTREALKIMIRMIKNLTKDDQDIMNSGEENDARAYIIGNGGRISGDPAVKSVQVLGLHLLNSIRAERGLAPVGDYGQKLPSGSKITLQNFLDAVGTYGHKTVLESLLQGRLPQ